MCARTWSYGCCRPRPTDSRRRLAREPVSLPPGRRRRAPERPRPLLQLHAELVGTQSATALCALSRRPRALVEQEVSSPRLPPPSGQMGHYRWKQYHRSQPQRWCSMGTARPSATIVAEKPKQSKERSHPGRRRSCAKMLRPWSWPGLPHVSAWTAQARPPASPAGSPQRPPRRQWSGLALTSRIFRVSVKRLKTEGIHCLQALAG